jgi:hypothetical protein
MPELDKAGYISIEKRDPFAFNIRRLQRFRRLWVILSFPSQVDPEMFLMRKIHNSSKFIRSYKITKANDEFSILISLYEIGKDDK